TVRKRLSRARKLLQSQLTRRGVSMTAVLGAVGLGTNGVSAGTSRAILVSTAKAAVQIASGKAPAGGLVSPNVLQLAKGVSLTMLTAKFKMAIGLLLCAALFGAGLGQAALPRPDAESTIAPLTG